MFILLFQAVAVTHSGARLKVTVQPVTMAFDSTSAVHVATLGTQTRWRPSVALSATSVSASTSLVNSATSSASFV